MKKLESLALNAFWCHNAGQILQSNNSRNFVHGAHGSRKVNLLVWVYVFFGRSVCIQGDSKSH